MGMDFDSDYWHFLDKKTEDVIDVKPKDLGISSKMAQSGTALVRNLNADIQAGAATVELGFTGKGKSGFGGEGGITPETVGQEEREMIRQLGKVNEVNVTTHASIGISNLSGMEREGFSDISAQSDLNEVKKAIDFAADATGGGPVVVHTSEFPREMAEIEKDKFETYPKKEGDVPKEEVSTLVDRDTGKIVRIPKGTELDVPKYRKNEQNQYIDYMGRVIPKNELPLRGVPVYDKHTGTIEYEKKTWHEFEKESNKLKEEGVEMSPAQLFYRQFQQAELERTKPYIESYRSHYEIINERLKSLNRTKAVYKVAQEKNLMNEDALRSKLIEDLQHARIPLTEKQNSDLIYGRKPALQVLDEEIGKMEYEAQSQKEGFMGYQKQAEQIEKQWRDMEADPKKAKIVEAKDFALERSARNYARAAMYAYDVQKTKKLDRDLFVSPENVFPEGGYGSHPTELKELVIDARKEMTEMLKQKGKDPKEAVKIAEDHIKATFDIGHAYTWKKFFKTKPGWNEKKRDEEFNKWLMNQVEDLVDKKIIGHVHISDNFGYHDEHLTPGHGNVPLKDFVKKLKEKNYKGEMIVEWGAQPPEEQYDVMTGAWGLLGTTPLYRTMRWTDIEDSFLGQTKRSYHVVGPYASTISEEYVGEEKGKPFWSGLGLE